MKKIKYFLFSLFMLFGIVSVAKANTIYSIDVTAVLDEEGNAKITEVWNMRVDKGTEVYKPMGNFGNSEISDFHVFENEAMYEYQANWNINGTLSSKQNKNGINHVNGGIELCWGMGSYGKHTYTITYDVSNVIYNVDDAQVLYWKFINDNMDPAPQKFSVTVKGPNYYEDTLDVWGYGYKGYAYVENGFISMSNSDDRNFKSNEYSVLLVKYPLGTFKTDNHISDYHTFNDFYTKAEEGSFKYNDDSSPKKNIDSIIRVLFYLTPMILILVMTIISNKPKFKYKKESIDIKNVNNFRDIPCDKNIFNAYFLSQIYGLNRRKQDLLGAILLKWIKEDKIRIEKRKKRKLFRTVEVVTIDLGYSIFGTSYENHLYNMMVEASEDGILQGKELKKWCSSNYSKFFKWFDTVIDYIRDEYVKSGHITVTQKGKLYPIKEYNLDQYLCEEAKKLAGLKKYLKEFSLIKEKQPIEVAHWEEYLMYAQVFGIAKEVANQFKNLYPELIENNQFQFDYNDVMLIESISSSSIKSAFSTNIEPNSLSSSSGSSDSYSSGGGGFSSGGGGGGSFGGGSGGGCR